MKGSPRTGDFPGMPDLVRGSEKRMNQQIRRTGLRLEGFEGLFPAWAYLPPLSTDVLRRVLVRYMRHL
jgi:hypothetical protein